MLKKFEGVLLDPAWGKAMGYEGILGKDSSVHMLL